MSVALNLCFLCNLRYQAKVDLFGGKHVMLRIQLFFGTIALFVRIESITVALFIGFLRIELTEKLYSKGAYSVQQGFK